MMNQAAVKGELDVRIVTAKYKGDFGKITNGINDTMNATVGVLRDIGSNLDRLSAGDFSAQVTSEMTGDYLVLKTATNILGTNLNNLIIDSSMMNQAAVKGELDVRIATAKYKGDFGKITNGINDTMNVTVGVLRDVGNNLARLSAGDFSAQISSGMTGDYELLKNATNALSDNLTRYAKQRDEHAWIQEGVANLSSQLAKIEQFQPLMQTAISVLARYVSAGKGAIYLYEPYTQSLSLMGSYAFVARSALAEKFKLGEGVVGQVALERQPILLKHLTRDDGIIMTATTAEPAINTYTFPLVYKEVLVGVIELASGVPFDDKQQTYLSQSIETLSAAIFSAQKANETQILLQQTQEQAVQLETQTREVELQNAELEQQKQETERQARELEVAQRSLQQQNESLVLAQKDLERRAQELAASNKYKGEFLANMTHELRTPLNAINVLAGLLRKNVEGNLTAKQVEHLEVIHYSGTDLLNLINDLLDLSRIEAGQMTMSLEVFNPIDLAEELKGMFEPLVQEKDLLFTLEAEQDVVLIQSDKAKLRQIIKNLLSNAIKFTHDGGLTLSVVKGKTDQYPVEIRVKDTGCGIPEDKLDEIFESFRQVDGSTSRKFGGTGLGLAISRELAEMLGGEIYVTSQVDQGSVFALRLPKRVPTEHLDPSLIEEIEESMPLPVAVSRASTPLKTPSVLAQPLKFKPSSHTSKILIIDDDKVFVKLIKSELLTLGYQVFVAENGREGLSMAKENQPDGILLDRRLPHISGDDVLKLLKRDPQTRHIPIKIISAEDPDNSLRRYGALGVIQKPIEPKSLEEMIHKLLSYNDMVMREVVLLEDDNALQFAMTEIMSSCLPNTKLSCFNEADKALAYLEQNRPSVIVVDLGLPGVDGFDVVDRINELHCQIPVIIYTGRELNAEQLKRLRQYSDAVILKTTDSLSRLVDEVGLFLHSKINSIRVCREKVDAFDATAYHPLEGVEVLIVDDDVRNLFALQALLENSGMKAIAATHGSEALTLLNEHHEVRAVLTDIMMPEMDGYELIRRIRSSPSFAHLPVIALTAKTGSDEREKCMKAGADDYLTKPIDEAMLLALLRVWVSQSHI